jgi:hypothetical protein
VQLDDRAGLSVDERDDLARRLARLRSLEDVVRWGFAQAPPLVVADVITQDEFTHDVLLPHGARWLVFDTT